MQELAVRLTALDPESSESLRVISYFDALVANGASHEAIVRAAAVLSGVTAGAQTSARRTVVDSSGHRLTDAASSGDEYLPSAVRTGDRTVWLERSGPPHANDRMILDRFALAVSIADLRPPTADAAALDVALDGDRTASERAGAITRLRLDGRTPLRVIAVHATVDIPAGRSTVIADGNGLLRAVVTPTDFVPASGPAGHAIAATPGLLAEAWRDARIALRLTDHRHPIVLADDLGTLVELCRVFDPTKPQHPDVTTVLDLDEYTRELLDVLVESDSVRAAASKLSMHHSSLQSRHDSLTRQLGYDPRSSLGRSRYEAARMLARLALSAVVSRA